MDRMLTSLIVIYCICLVVVLHNVFKYLYLGKRWHIAALLLFYVCVLIIIGFRAISLIFFKDYYKDEFKCERDRITADELDTVAMTAWAVLGLV